MLLDTHTTSIMLRVNPPSLEGYFAITAEYEDTLRQAVTTKTVYPVINVTGDTVFLTAPEKSTARRIVELHICNFDNLARSIQLVVAHPTGIQIIQNVFLNSGDTLHYNRYNGWSIQLAGEDGRIPIMRNYRKVTGVTVVTVSLLDGIIDIDTTGVVGGRVKLVFVPSIVTTPNYAHEIEVNKIDITDGAIDINDGVNNIDEITTPVNGSGGAGGSKNIRSNGMELRTWGVG